jgi:hypothetical protein
VARRVFYNPLISVSNALIAIALVIISLLFGYVLSISFSVFGASLSAARLALAVKAIRCFGVFAKVCAWQDLLTSAASLRIGHIETPISVTRQDADYIAGALLFYPVFVVFC